MPLSLLLKSLFILSLLLFSGCGSEGNSDGNRLVNGKVMDDYLENATVCIDKNEDYLCGADEASATSGRSGNYALVLSSREYGNYPILAIADTNSYSVDENGTRTPLSDTIKLMSPKEKLGNISPITTLIYKYMKDGSTLQEAENRIMVILGITDVNDLYADYMMGDSAEVIKIREFARSVGTDLLGASDFDKAMSQAQENASSGRYSGESFRLFSINNYCPYPVKLSSKGSNASQIACSTTDCPSGYFCYKKDDTTRYCIPGSVSGVSLPVTDLNASGVTIDKSGCKAGSDAYSPGNQFVPEGQCRCRKDSDCGDSQMCVLVDADNYWGACFWHLGNNGGEFIDTNKTATIKINPNATKSQPNKTTIQSGGRFDINIGCDASGNCASNADNSNPTTSIEFTLASNGPDFYDVSYINGMNSPAVFYPDYASTSKTFVLDNNYSCGAAGTDATSLSNIIALQKTYLPNAQAPMEYFNGLACDNNFSSQYSGTDLIGFNFVYNDKNASSQTVCTTHADCNGADGGVCGLTFAQVSDNNDTTVCGYRVGYWTYAQFCAVNNSFASSKLKIGATDVNCSGNSGKNKDYSLCKVFTQTSAAVSCWNENDPNCCGVAEWSIGGKDWKEPGFTKKNSSTNWTTYIEPFVKIVKDSCPLAYSYQYDDPYSTFTCKVADGNNTFGYKVDLCKEGSAGINPPMLTCDNDVFSSIALSLPPGYEASIKKGSGVNGAFSTDVTLETNNTFSLGSSYEYYKITASNLDPDKNATCSCVYKLKQNGCVVGELDSSDSGICCSQWSLTSSANPPSIGITQFYGAGDTSVCPSNRVASGNNNNFLITAPANYNIKVTYDGNTTVLYDANNTVNVNLSTYNVSSIFDVNVTNSAGNKTITCKVTAPIGQVSIVADKNQCDMGGSEFQTTCDGAWAGRNLTTGGF